MAREQITYHVLKATEGGMGQRMALLLCRNRGIKVSPVPSCYVGQTAVTGNHTKRERAVVCRLLGVA